MNSQKVAIIEAQLRTIKLVAQYCMLHKTVQAATRQRLSPAMHYDAANALCQPVQQVTRMAQHSYS